MYTYKLHNIYTYIHTKKWIDYGFKKLFLGTAKPFVVPRTGISQVLLHVVAHFSFL